LPSCAIENVLLPTSEVMSLSHALALLSERTEIMEADSFIIACYLGKSY